MSLILYCSRVRSLVMCLALAAAVRWVPTAQAQEERQPEVVNLPAPRLTGTTNDWLNTNGKPLTLEKGRVYVVEFWTFGCINCQRNLPSYARWQKQFAKEKFTIIGVHTPETASEKKPENVAQQVKKRDITYPVLIDGTKANWKRWQQEIWPTVYLVDKRGQVRYRWVGELDWQQAGGEAKMARCIEALLRE